MRETYRDYAEDSNHSCLSLRKVEKHSLLKDEKERNTELNLSQKRWDKELYQHSKVISMIRSSFDDQITPLTFYELSVLYERTSLFY